MRAVRFCCPMWKEALQASARAAQADAGQLADVLEPGASEGHRIHASRGQVMAPDDSAACQHCHERLHAAAFQNKLHYLLDRNAAASSRGVPVEALPRRKSRASEGSSSM